MNVKELKEAIMNLPDDMKIYMSRDEEGNNFNELYEVNTNNIVIDDGRRNIDVYDPDWTADDCLLDEEYWEELKKNPRSIVLWP